MENTVEALLNHGDQDPQLLLQNLKSGNTANNNTSLDEELARQLSSQRQIPGAQTANINNSSGAGSSSSSAPGTSTPGTASYLPNYTPRGTPTKLPDDFLRIEAGTSTLDSDEALARMLQDQLFSEELRRNPDFAHLAGRPRVSSAHQQHQRAAAAGGRSSFNAQTNQPMPMPNIMEKLSGKSCQSLFIIYILFSVSLPDQEMLLFPLPLLTGWFLHLNGTKQKRNGCFCQI